MAAFRAVRLISELNAKNMAMALRGRRLLSPLSSTLVSQPAANYFIKNGKVHKYKSEFWMPSLDETRVTNYEFVKIPLWICYICTIIFAYLVYDVYFVT